MTSGGLSIRVCSPMARCMNMIPAPGVREWRMPLSIGAGGTTQLLWPATAGPNARERSARPHNRIMIDAFRIERDTTGDMQIPASALYGPATARAVQNFPISGRRFPRSFIRALGIVKSAAAKMNGRMGHLPAPLAESIEAAAEQVVEGRHDNEFPIDIFQTGSGTSTNMNANEVIGHLAGAHPNDHVNRGQSSNDVIPAAMHIAVAESLVARLLPAMRQLGASLERKTAEFHDIIK